MKERQETYKQIKVKHIFGFMCTDWVCAIATQKKPLRIYIYIYNAQENANFKTTMTTKMKRRQIKINKNQKKKFNTNRNREKIERERRKKEMKKNVWKVETINNREFMYEKA